MNRSDLQKFSTILIGAREVLGQSALSEYAMELWFESLKSYSIEEISRAFTEEISNPDRKKFFPDPSDIVRQIEGTSAERAMAAWNIVSKCDCSAYDTVIFEDPIIHQVISDMGGWVSFNEPSKWGRFSGADGDTYGYTDQQFNFFRKEFMDRYTAMLKTGAPNAPKKLVGVTEIHNQRNFPHHVPQPIRISHDGKKLLPQEMPKYILPEQKIGEAETPASPDEVKKMIAAVSEKLKTNSSDPF